ncbi:DUF2065 domain-containing protein [Roseinatronobacter alkalisoli]|uniref:DUF2065 domain-containing protein n=1 Tax=Roseinatronobacter alkalisoli TaxID=3028235 RepID=A0ABT5T4A5_9RHOB|nr:DUF2065 domain-containing protein [Roseinatronobacter sp. HJB301]MDD7969816.1 DUF2065 domain-containing protein [Roseinatronobacter sp. HJB301]
MSVWTLVLALGLVLIVEGLAFVLAPRRIEDLLRVFADLPVDIRRLIGLLALVLGGMLITVALWMGA